MSQLNLNLTPEFERELRKLMKLRGIEHKSEAIRVAVREALARIASRTPVDYGSWLGLGKQAPENKRPRFANDDDIWRE